MKQLNFLIFLLLKIGEKDAPFHFCFVARRETSSRGWNKPPVIYFEGRIWRFLQVGRASRQHVAENAILRNYVSQTLHQRGHCNSIRDRTIVTDHVLSLKDDQKLITVYPRAYLDNEAMSWRLKYIYHIYHFEKFQLNMKKIEQLAITRDPLITK